MNILEKVKSTFLPASRQGKHTVHSPVADPAQNINTRLEEIYGQDAINLQKLYEKWVIMDTWLVRDEAIPLLLGLDPESDIPGIEKPRIDELWKHAESCVQRDLLQVTSEDQGATAWCATPVEIYRWAIISRIAVPETFSSMMAFVANTMKEKTGSNGGNYNKESKNNDDGMAVLGMAFAILALSPDSCKDVDGKINIDQVISIINDKNQFWLGERKLDLSTTTIRNILVKWLSTVEISVSE